MKLRLTALVLSTIVSTSQAAETAANVKLKDQTDKVSYSIGIDIGKSFHEQSIKINEQAFLAGVRDGQNAGPALMTDNEIRDTLVGLQKEIAEKSLKNET